MSLKENVREELKRSPLAVFSTIATVVLAALALLVAWLQYAGEPSVAASNAVSPVPVGDLQLSNLLVVVSFFLAATFSAASVIRILERSHPFPAMVLSVPAAVGAGFCTLLVLKLVPPRALTPDLLGAGRDAVFWGTLFVFVAINGLSVIRGFIHNSASQAPRVPVAATKSAGDNGADGGVSLVGVLFMLAVWGGLVSAGMTKLTLLFLT